MHSAWVTAGLPSSSVVCSFSFSVTYEDPQAVKGLASALDVRKQNTGGVGHCSAFCYLKPCMESKL